MQGEAMELKRFSLVISRLEDEELADVLRLIFPSKPKPESDPMELRKPTIRITTAEWIEKQRRDLARFVMGRPYIVVLDEATKEQVYYPVELVDSDVRGPKESRG
jgi:hypothetical protein